MSPQKKRVLETIIRLSAGGAKVSTLDVAKSIKLGKSSFYASLNALVSGRYVLIEQISPRRRNLIALRGVNGKALPRRTADYSKENICVKHERLGPMPMPEANIGTSLNFEGIYT